MQAAPQRPGSRKAVVLLAVLVVVVLLSLAAYRYSDWMFAEFRGAEAAGNLVQAQAVAESGVDYVMALLAANIDEATGGNPWDNPTLFQNIQLTGADGKVIGRFSIVSPRQPDD